jgi:putative membrane protein
VAALLATTVLMGLLGALLTFAPVALYAPHTLTTAAWGLTPLEDQQTAGLIMWIPAAGVYLASALSILAGVLRPRLAAA